MEINPIIPSRKYTEEELRWAIAAEAEKELQQLNSDSLIGWSETGDISQPDETRKLADLPETPILSFPSQKRERSLLINFCIKFLTNLI